MALPAIGSTAWGQTLNDHITSLEAKISAMSGSGIWTPRNLTIFNGTLPTVWTGHDNNLDCSNAITGVGANAAVCLGFIRLNAATATQLYIRANATVGSEATSYFSANALADYSQGLFMFYTDTDGKADIAASVAVSSKIVLVSYYIPS